MKAVSNLVVARFECSYGSIKNYLKTKLAEKKPQLRKMNFSNKLSRHLDGFY